jgi:hypothetical protein
MILPTRWTEREMGASLSNERCVLWCGQGAIQALSIRSLSQLLGARLQHCADCRARSPLVTLRPLSR